MANFNDKDWTRVHEGFRDEVYLDSLGKPTIGVGHLITPSSPFAHLKEGDKADKAALEAQYDEDYAKHAKQAERVFPGFYRHPSHVQEALINMVFQLGNKPAKWNDLQHNLQKALETGDYAPAAAAAADSRWYRDQTPARARSVLDRMVGGSEYAYTEDDTAWSDDKSDKRYGKFAKAPSKNEWSKAREIDAMVPQGPQIAAEPAVPHIEDVAAIQQAEDELASFAVPEIEMPAPEPVPVAQPVAPVEVAELPAAPLYDNPELDAYHKRNQTGLYGGGEMSLPGYADGFLDNPEAGPSDTVPAMLTPGEAVIPASVAMDEDYKPVIEEMVHEGRRRNRMAEDAGIPVNHPAVPGFADGKLDKKISKLYKEGYDAPGQAYAVAKSMGYQGGTDMVPKPMGAPPKYNVARPDHSEFNKAPEMMGEGAKMDMTNAKHRQQVANKEGAQAQKMDHMMATDMYKMKMDDMKADQKLYNKQREKLMDLDLKRLENDVDAEQAIRKQEALTASMEGLGMVPPPMETPPAPQGFAGGTEQVAYEAQRIQELQAQGYEPDVIRSIIEQSRELAPVAQAQIANEDIAASGGQTVGLPDIPQISFGLGGGAVPQAAEAYGNAASARHKQYQEVLGKADGGDIPGFPDQTLKAIYDFGGSLAPEAPVPEVPMQAVPADAPGGMTFGELDQTDIGGFKNMLANTEGITPEQAYVDPEYAAREARYQEQVEANKKAEAEAATAAKQQATEANKQTIEQATAVLNDPTVDPAEKNRARRDLERAEQANASIEANDMSKAEELLVANTEAAALGEEGVRLDPADEQTLQDEIDDPTTGTDAATIDAAKKAPPQEKQGWLSTMGSAFKEVFGSFADPNSLATMAIVYGANLALGQDSDTALQQGLKFYQKSLQNKAAKEQVAVEQAAKLQEYELKKQIDAKYKAPEDLAAARKEQAKLRRQSVEKGRKHGEEIAAAALKTVGTQQSTDKYGRSTSSQVITLTDKAAGGQFEKFLTDITPEGAELDHNAPGVTQAMDNAVRAAVAHSKETGEDVQDLTPFLWASYIPESTGRGAQDFKGIPAKRMAELTSRIPTQPGKSKGTAIQENFGLLQKAYAKLAQSNPKAFAEYEAKKPNGFYNFARERLDKLNQPQPRKGYADGIPSVEEWIAAQRGGFMGLGWGGSGASDEELTKQYYRKYPQTSAPAPRLYQGRSDWLNPDTAGTLSDYDELKGEVESLRRQLKDR